MKINQDIANNLLEQKKYREATQAFLDILQQDPSSGQAYQGMAQCYYRLKNYEAASSSSMKAIELDQTLVIPHVILAYIYYYCDNDLNKHD